MILRGSEGQFRALRALVGSGTEAEAARSLGITPRAMRRRLYTMRRRNDATTAQLAYWLDRDECQVGLWRAA